jgi:hypothetical protein
MFGWSHGSPIMPAGWTRLKAHYGSFWKAKTEQMVRQFKPTSSGPVLTDQIVKGKMPEAQRIRSRALIRQVEADR